MDDEEIAKLSASVAASRESVLAQYGTIVANEITLLAMVETHPNPSQLLAKLQEQFEIAEAQFLGASRSEAALNQLQEARKRSIGLCQQWLAKQEFRK